MNEHVYSIGAARFDLAQGKLLRGGRAIQLDRPSAAILRELVSNAGGEVGKDRLLEAGWPGRVVHENSLAKAISRLRQALGEDGDALETVHGFGYRLTAQPAGAAQPSGNDELAHSRKPVLVLSAAGVLALAAAWLAYPPSPAASIEEPELVKGEAADSIGRVLWVDDNPQNNTTEKRWFEANKVAVYQVQSTDEALKLLAMYRYDAVISDMNRDNKPLEGIALVKEMRSRGEDTPFVLYSVVPSEAQQVFVAEAGGQAATVARDDLYRAVMSFVGDSQT